MGWLETENYEVKGLRKRVLIRVNKVISIRLDKCFYYKDIACLLFLTIIRLVICTRYQVINIICLQLHDTCYINRGQWIAIETQPTNKPTFLEPISRYKITVVIVFLGLFPWLIDSYFKKVNYERGFFYHVLPVMTCQYFQSYCPIVNKDDIH